MTLTDPRAGCDHVVARAYSSAEAIAIVNGSPMPDTTPIYVCEKCGEKAVNIPHWNMDTHSDELWCEEDAMSDTRQNAIDALMSYWKGGTRYKAMREWLETEEALEAAGEVVDVVLDASGVSGRVLGKRA